MRDAVSNPAQVALIEELPRDRLVLIAADSPYDLLAVPDAPTCLALYSHGQEISPVLCDVLLGRLEPGGVLPLALSDRYQVGDGLPSRAIAR